jgi:hypothetical protein
MRKLTRHTCIMMTRYVMPRRLIISLAVTVLTAVSTFSGRPAGATAATVWLSSGSKVHSAIDASSPKTSFRPRPEVDRENGIAWLKDRVSYIRQSGAIGDDINGITGGADPGVKRVAAGIHSDQRQDWHSSTDAGGTAHLIHAMAGTLASAFAHCPGGRNPSDMCVVVADPGRTYIVPSALIIGSNTNPQTLLCMGGTIVCTDSGGAGHGCLVIADKGHLKAPTGAGAPAAAQGCVVTAKRTANIDSLVESYAGYAYSTLGEKDQQVNFDVENITITPNPGMAGLNKAALWVSAVDGDAWISNIYVGPGPTGSTGVLVDDAPTGSAYRRMYWNNLNFNDVWVGMGNDAYAVKVRCGATRASAGANLTWTGGALVDGRSAANVAEFSANGGRSGNCIGVLLQDVYFESDTGQAGDYMDLNGVLSFVGHSLIFNGGPPLANCISISGVAGDQIHVDGRATSGMRCTNVIYNTASSPTYIDKIQGAFNYEWAKTGSQPIKQIGGLVNPFGPGGQGTYYANVAHCTGSGTPAPCCTGPGTGPDCIALPACSAAYARYMVCTGDSAQCTSGKTYSSSSTGVWCLLQCNNAGNAWKETGVSCF